MTLWTELRALQKQLSQLRLQGCLEKLQAVDQPLQRLVLEARAQVISEALRQAPYDHNRVSELLEELEARFHRL